MSEPCPLHGLDNCPLCYPKAWPKQEREAHPMNMAVDSQGTPLPYSPKEVQNVIRHAVEQGDLVAAIFRLPDGNMAVEVFGPPSQELVEVLETTLNAYKRTLRGH